MRAKKTKITPDLGTFFHALFGFLSVILGREWLFTIIFIIKQVVLDCYFGHEDFGITSGDLAEYSAGLIMGLILILFL